MILVGLIVGLTIPILFGNIFLYFLDSEKVLKTTERLSLSFLLGYSGITIFLFWSFLLNLPHRVFIISGIVIALFVLKSFFVSEFGLSLKWIPEIKDQIVQRKGKNFFTSRNIILGLLLILIIFKLSYAFVEACSKPEYTWDASAFWTMDGKSFFYLNQEQPGEILKYFLMLPNYHPEYPKQVQLMHFWLFNWMGETNDQWSKIFFPITLGAFLTLFYTSLRKTRGNLGAGIFTYFLLSSPLFLYLSTVGYADFTLSVYFSLGIIFFYRWTREKQDIYFWLFTIFISLTSWVKLEGKPLGILGLFIMIIYVWNDHNRSVKAILTRVGRYLSAFLVIALPWQLFVVFNQLETRERLASHLGHFFDLHSQIYTKLFAEGSWGVFWLAAVAAVLFFYKRLLNKENFYLAMTFLLFYSIVLFIFQLTSDGYAVFGVSFNRVWLSVYPIAVFMLGCIIPAIDLRKLGEV